LAAEPRSGEAETLTYSKVWTILKLARTIFSPPAGGERLPFHLVFYEAFLSKEDAKRREGYFKTNKGKKALKLMLLASLKSHEPERSSVHGPKPSSALV